MCPTPVPGPCLLLILQASLGELNRQLAYKGEGELPLDRFRPNLAVRGAAAWAEDRWAALRVGADGVEFDK